MRSLISVTIVLGIAAFDAFAGTDPPPITADFGVQQKYAANLALGESYINIVNTGAVGAPLLGPGLGATVGNICVNVYAIDPGEELISCCSCLVTADQVVSLGVNRDLTAKTLTGVIPNSVTVKLYAILAGGDGTGSNCKNSAAENVTGSGVPNWIVTAGLAAWGTTLHTAPGGGVVTTETPFTPVTFSTSSAGSNFEYPSLTQRCAAIIGNASTFGICNSCRAGALGAMKQ